VEKLVVLREEYNKRYATTVDAQERQNLAIHSNTKRSIYLQAAELLVKDLGEEVSSTEYYVIGQENEFESDFQQARDYYRLAVNASANSSISDQSLAWRSLAGSYFWLEPYRNVSEGRKCFEEAIKRFQGENDPYLLYLRGFAYRYWASREYSAENFDEASDKLELAYEEIRRLPNWYTLKAEELRLIADFWRWIANHYWNTQRNEQGIEKGRGCIRRAIEVIDGLTDDNSNDVRGQIYLDWGCQEMRTGSRDEGVSLIRQADQHYRKLPALYPSRDMRFRVFEQAVSQLAQEMGISIVEITGTVS
jgi:tetratricopeptide (TPR) repeat protein